MKLVIAEKPVSYTHLALTAAFTEYTGKTVRKAQTTERPSVLAKLSQFKELVTVSYTHLWKLYGGTRCKHLWLIRLKVIENGTLCMQKARHWAAWHLKLPKF